MIVWLQISHPDFDNDVIPLKSTLYHQYLESIQSSYNTLTNGQVSTYVEQMDQALAEGAIDIADMISPSAAIEEFA